MRILDFHRINTVFDIGANSGGFGKYLRSINYSGRIISFEPMKQAHDALMVATNGDSEWIAAPRAAIGAEDGSVDINIAGNSESSSILAMLDAHAAAAPSSAYVGKETVGLSRLDTVSGQYLRPDSKLFLKIDTQGYEEQVLLGGVKTAEAASVIQLELSLVELYEGQKLMPAMVEQMRCIGFDLWGLNPVFADPKSGRMLQMDGIFCKFT